MALSSIPMLATRAFQILFATIVLGLSITLIKDHKEGRLPTTLAFAAVVSALSLLAALLGVVVSFKNFLHDEIRNIIDGVVLLLNIAGGIMMAMKLRGVSCNVVGSEDDQAVSKALRSEILCGGMVEGVSGLWSCYYNYNGHPEVMDRRCRESTADATFMFLTAVVLLAVGILSYLRMKSGH